MAKKIRPELMPLPLYAGASRWRRRTAKLRSANRAAEREKTNLTASARALWAEPGAPQLRKGKP